MESKREFWIDIENPEEKTKVLPPEPIEEKRLQVGEIIHVEVAHNGGRSGCHAALVTDTQFGSVCAWVFPCGSCNNVASRISLQGIDWHRLEECKR